MTTRNLITTLTPIGERLNNDTHVEMTNSDKLTQEAKLRVKQEYETKISERYRTLFFGLRLNHPHNATVVHPSIFILRRITYAATVLFMFNTSIITAYLLSVICIGVIAFVVIEKPWKDSFIAKQHILNEIALYMIFSAVISCSMPMSSEVSTYLGWTMIYLIQAVVAMNLVAIAYSTSAHTKLFIKR